MELWLNAVGEYGLTTVIAFYLLHRMEKKLDILIHTVQSKSESLASINSAPPVLEDDEDYYQSLQ
ncbi:YvrJ family protein [Salibacterium salarium]|nr:YvrJ family protein [Salibacterium salarium]